MFSTRRSEVYTYNGLNVRVGKAYKPANTAPFYPVSYLQDSLAQYPVVLQETDRGTRREYLYPPGSDTPLLQTNPVEGAIWSHSDGLGSVRALTNRSGTLVMTTSYAAFGESLEGTSQVSFNNHLFAGEQQDLSGLYYLRARYYHPGIGRFISRDMWKGESTNPQSLNKYGYVENNPSNWTDPSGNAPNKPIERQIIAAACEAAMLKGLEPLCDVPSQAFLYFVDGILMAFNPAEANQWILSENKEKLLGRPSYGSARDLYFANLAHPDIVTRKDYIESTIVTQNGMETCANIAKVISGVYEVEPANNPTQGILQAVTYMSLANLASEDTSQATKNSQQTYSHRTWRLGIGLASFNTTLYLVFAGEVKEYWARWVAPGLILYEELQEEKRKQKTTPTPNVPNVPEFCVGPAGIISCKNNSK